MVKVVVNKRNNQQLVAPDALDPHTLMVRLAPDGERFIFEADDGEGFVCLGIAKADVKELAQRLLAWFDTGLFDLPTDKIELVNREEIDNG